MTKPARIVDAHVHLWDPARADWYPYLAGGDALNLGDTTAMRRLFDVATYQTEAAGWNVEKLVNVAAATAEHSIEETLFLDQRADVDGQPDALVGSLPPSDTVAEAIAMIDQQMVAKRFRGVRPMGKFAAALPAPEVLSALRDRSLVFELMTHPDQLELAARGLEGFDDLVVVLEHTGWPRSPDDDEVALWRQGMDALAGVGENVVCKLSGLAMPLKTMSADAFRPWIEYAIDAFGPDRCLWASNFPVDGMHGTLNDLLVAYTTATDGLDDRARDAVFAATAERVYRI